MRKVLGEMLRTQEMINLVAIGQHWRTANCNFRLAIAQECAEGIDHLGWKWWTSKQPNMEAAKVEVIDIVHFALADTLQQKGEASFEELAESLFNSWIYRTSDIIVAGQTFDPKNMSVVDGFQAIATLAGLGKVDFGLIVWVGERLSMDFEALAKLYRQKATLNLFRQQHGYKEGKYIKMWGKDLEDNDYMQQVSAQIDWSDPRAATHLNALLERAYAQVLIEQTAR
jgi:hypothetical protein